MGKFKNPQDIFVYNYDKFVGLYPVSLEVSDFSGTQVSTRGHGPKHTAIQTMRNVSP
jgi:hypothetical protein